MIAYIIRRCLYAIPILIGVNVLVFMLFFFVDSPDDMARAQLGQKRVTPEQIDQWKREHSLDLPYFYNAGWRQLSSLAARTQTNTGEFLTAGEGAYALIVEAPTSQKAAQQRTVHLQSDQPDRLALPKEFDADGNVTLPATTETQRFLFRIAPPRADDQPPPRLTVVHLAGCTSCDQHHRILLPEHPCPTTGVFVGHITQYVGDTSFIYNETGKNFY